MTDSTTYFLQAYYMMGGLSCQCADLHRKFCANQPAFSAKFYKIMDVFHKINQCYMKKECKIRSKLQYLCSKLDEDGMSNRIKNAPPKQRIF